MTRERVPAYEESPPFYAPAFFQNLPSCQKTLDARLCRIFPTPVVPRLVVKASSCLGTSAFTHGFCLVAKDICQATIGYEGIFSFRNLRLRTSHWYVMITLDGQL